MVKRYKVVRSSNPMINKNYKGHIGKLVGEPTTRAGKKMLHLDFGKHGQQTFYPSEVRLVRQPKKRRR